MHDLGLEVWPFPSSFKRLIFCFTLQSCLQCYLHFIFCLTDCQSHNGCGLSTSAAYMQVLTVLFADLLSVGKCYEACGLSWIF